jgi:hypothetical protein
VSARGKTAQRGRITVKRQTQLLEIVLALHPSSRFPRALNGWQKQPHENADNGDDHQQLDQSKPGDWTMNDFSHFLPLQPISTENANIIGSTSNCKVCKATANRSATTQRFSRR